MMFNSFGNSHVSGQSLLTYRQLSECIKKRFRGLVWWAAGLFFLVEVDNAIEIIYTCFWINGSSSSRVQFEFDRLNRKPHASTEWILT